MREMFTDVMTRAHKRFRDMDERTEDEVIVPLNSLVNMMAKATDKILGLDEIINQTSTKSISEEMLDVIMPTLERIEREERDAHFTYKNLEQKPESEDDEILGFD